MAEVIVAVEFCTGERILTVDRLSVMDDPEDCLHD
jgi:hypothetical protein